MGLKRTKCRHIRLPYTQNSDLHELIWNYGAFSKNMSKLVSWEHIAKVSVWPLNVWIAYIKGLNVAILYWYWNVNVLYDPHVLAHCLFKMALFMGKRIRYAAEISAKPMYMM